MATTNNQQLPFNYPCVKVADKSGNIVRNVYRTPTGGLVVRDQEGFNKYMKELKAEKAFKEVKEELEELREMMKNLLKEKTKEQD